MATLTYRPGQGVSTDLPRPGELLAGFLVAPVATVVGGLVEGATQFVRGLFGRDRAGPADFAVIADSETGRLTAPKVEAGRALEVPTFTPRPTRDVLGRPTAPQRPAGLRAAEQQLALLQRTFDTGQIQPGITANFQAYAAALVQFREDIDAAKEPPEPEEPFEPLEPLEPDDEEPFEPDDAEPLEPDEGLAPRPGDQPFLPFPDFSPNILTDIPSFSPPGVEGFFMPSFARGIPGGSAGFNQQTTAGKMLLLGRGRAIPGRGRRRRRRRPIKTPPRATAKRATSFRRAAATSKFNSPAWMAKIRKLRGKKKRKVK